MTRALGAAAAVVALTLAVAGVMQTTSATAQQRYPDHTIRMLVGFPPGGGIDVVARLFANKMSQMLQQTVVVENRPGAAGSIAAGQVANATPDGYAILAGSNSIIINRIMNPKSSLDVERDLHVIALIARQPMIAIAHPGSKIASLDELVATARERPVNFGTPGANSIPHLLFEQFVLSLPGTKMIHVPFPGAGQVLTAAIAGQIDAAMVTLPTAMPLIESKQVRPLAVTSKLRTPMLPEVPTTAEAGFPAIVGSIWGAVFVPAKAPPAIIERLDETIQKISAMPDISQELAKLGFETANVTGAQFRAEMAEEIKTWTEVIDKANLLQR
jgi:tripartite-type tricarboxylate transporter receptor subunit TctC